MRPARSLGSCSAPRVTRSAIVRARARRTDPAWTRAKASTSASAARSRIDAWWAPPPKTPRLGSLDRSLAEAGVVHGAWRNTAALVIVRPRYGLSAERSNHGLDHPHRRHRRRRDGRVRLSRAADRIAD